VLVDQGQPGDQEPQQPDGRARGDKGTEHRPQIAGRQLRVSAKRPQQGVVGEPDVACCEKLEKNFKRLFLNYGHFFQKKMVFNLHFCKKEKN
jgi:hypothetical protein